LVIDTLNLIHIQYALCFTLSKKIKNTLQPCVYPKQYDAPYWVLKYPQESIEIDYTV